MRSSLSLSTFLAVCAVFLASTAVAAEWVREIVGHDLGHLDLAVDGGGTLHLVHTEVGDPTAPVFRYSTYAEAGWESEIVPERPVPGIFGLAIGASGEPHVAFVDSNAVVRYGTREAGAWSFDSFPPGDLPIHVALALDTSDDPHVAYITYGERVRYAHRSNGLWTDEEIDESWLSLSHSRVGVVLDAQGSVHVGARELFAGVGYYTRGPTAWTHENFGTAAQRPWVVLDEDGNAHFVTSGNGVHYATNQSGGWVTTVVDPDGATEDNHIALDPEGVPHIVYSVTVAVRYQAPDTYYDTRILLASPVDGVWQSEEVDSALDYTGAFTVRSRLAFDTDGTPHLLYRYPATGDLVHARRTQPTAVARPVGTRSLAITSVSPNPFNPRTQIEYRVEEPAVVRVIVYDDTGRRIRVLHDAPQSAGVATVIWDGRDRLGRAVASGVYFVSIDASGRRTTRKVVLAR